MNSKGPDFFSKEMAKGYDERNKKLSPISECLHFLTSLILKDLPVQARVLCVGAGTGAELLMLARVFPGWSFVALDPSNSMLEVCRERVAEAGFLDRCEFVSGYVQDMASEPAFDAVLSVLVGHFVPRDQRAEFYTQMSRRLSDKGYLVNAEISFDLESAEFPSMLSNWEKVQTMMGATPESLAMLPKQMREVLTILPPAEVDALLRQSGLESPVRFFQAMMICGWYARKTS